MACLSCKKKKEAAAKAMLQNSVNLVSEGSNEPLLQLYNSGDFEFVRYMGPSYNHIVAPVTRAVIAYGLKDYGMARKGNILLVHKDDIKAKPHIFVKLKEGSPVHKTQLARIGYTGKTSKPESVKTVKTIEKTYDEPTVVEKTKNESIENSEKTNEVTSTIDDVDNSLPIINKSNAITLDEYAEQYGYTHRLQVLALVKSGKLKSFKNDEDKTLVYTVDD